MSDNLSVAATSSILATFCSLKQLEKRYGVRLSVPCVCIVGPQTSGKSMLNQHFIQFPCTYTAQGTATRCPVAYTLRYNAECKNGPVVVEPAGVNKEGLAEYIKKHMKNIRGFSADALNIVLESNTYSDICIVDLPGFVSNGSDSDIQSVLSVVQKYVTDPSYSIIILGESDHDLQGQVGLATVRQLCETAKPPRTNWQQDTIRVYTKFDLYMKNTTTNDHTPAQISHHMEQLTEGMSTTFTAMVQGSFSFDDARKTFAEKEAYLKSVPALEQKTVNEWWRERETVHQGIIDTKFKRMIGLELTMSRIKQLWAKKFEVALPELLREVRSLYTCGETELSRLSSILTLTAADGTSDPHALHEMLCAYINEMYDQFRCVLQSSGTTFAHYTHVQCGRTWEQEMNNLYTWDRYHHFNWKPGHSRAGVRTFTLGDFDAEKRLIGSSRLTRLLRMFDFLVQSYEPREPSAETIASALAPLADGVQNIPLAAKAIKEIVLTQIMSTFKNGPLWLAQHARLILHQIRHDVKHHLLKGPFKSIAGYPHFLLEVDMSFDDLIRSHIRTFLSTFTKMRQSVSSYLTVDGIAKMALTLMAIPRSIPSIPPVKVLLPQPGTGSRDEASVISRIIPNPNGYGFGTQAAVKAAQGQQPNNIVEDVRLGVKEMYAEKCDLLLRVILALFNHEVLIGASSPVFQHRLSSRVSRFSPANLAHVCASDVPQTYAAYRRRYKAQSDIAQSLDDILCAQQQLQRIHKGTTTSTSTSPIDSWVAKIPPPIQLPTSMAEFIFINDDDVNTSANLTLDVTPTAATSTNGTRVRDVDDMSPVPVPILSAPLTSESPSVSPTSSSPGAGVARFDTPAAGSTSRPGASFATVPFAYDSPLLRFAVENRYTDLSVAYRAYVRLEDQKDLNMGLADKELMDDPQQPKPLSHHHDQDEDEEKDQDQDQDDESDLFPSAYLESN